MSQNSKIKHNLFERSQPVTSDFFDIPLLGAVRPDSAKNTNGNYDLSELVTNFQHDHIGALTVEVLDDAMFKAGIFKGDFITVQLNSQPKNSDIVVAKLGERFYVRRVFFQRGLIRLDTDNEYPSSLVIDPKTPGFIFLGKVVSLTRQF